MFACLFSIHNTINISPQKQVCLSGLRFERFFSHHWAMQMIMLCVFKGNFCTFGNMRKYAVCIFPLNIRNTIFTLHDERSAKQIAKYLTHFQKSACVNKNLNKIFSSAQCNYPYKKSRVWKHPNRQPQQVFKKSLFQLLF